MRSRSHGLDLFSSGHAMELASAPKPTIAPNLGHRDAGMRRRQRYEFGLYAQQKATSRNFFRLVYVVECCRKSRAELRMKANSEPT